MLPKSARSILTVAIGTLVLTQSLAAEPTIKVRELPSPVEISADTLGPRVSVCALSDGRVFVNDLQRSRALLHDKRSNTSPQRSIHREQAADSAQEPPFHLRITSHVRRFRDVSRHRNSRVVDN